MNLVVGLVIIALGALLSLSGTGGSFGDLMAIMQADPYGLPCPSGTIKNYEYFR